MNINNFSVSIYGQPEKFNDVLSKARLRIFYKYGNRNGTYITDEFADELLSSLPYVPVKGIYETDDFSDHGEERNEGRIYGIVPESPNVAWEKHMDEDGVEREYACCDVLLFTALYKEAGEIVGKAQSMELYEPAMKYHFATIDAQRYVVFDHGCFLGLQVLGDDVEPCFEGASFFTLQQNITDVIEKIKQYSHEGGQSGMPTMNFKMSDQKKCCALWDLLNTEYNAEGNWTVSYSIDCVYDDYALAYSYETGEFERIYYTKDDENDSVTISKRCKAYIIDVTEQEMNTLNALRALNGDTYECVSEKLSTIDATLATKAEEISARDNKIVEMEATISSLNMEKETLTEANAQLKSEYDLQVETNSNLTNQVTELATYKANIERQQKESVINQYVDHLSEEVLNTYRAEMDNYTAIDLDMRLTYECKKYGVGTFTATPSAGLVPTAPELDGVDAILSKYVK